MRARSFRIVPAVVALLFLACSSDEASGPPEVDQVLIITAAGDADVQVDRGGSVQLQARALRDGSLVSGIQFQWRSEAPAVATVDANGLLQGVEYGEAEIVADLVGAVGPSGRTTAQVVGPPVASIEIDPESAWVDTGDTLTLKASPRSSTGSVLGGVELTWSASSANLSVDAAGRMQGLTPGLAEVEARAWNDVTGTAHVRVTPVTGLEPDTGRYGAVMRIQGAGLPAGISRVEFTGAGASRVPAFIRSASATAVEVWVPAEARTGPIRLGSATDSFPTSRRFEITANDDIFEGGSCGGLECLYDLPVPYQNPSLLAAFDDVDAFVIELAAPSPISIYLVDRGPKTDVASVAALVVRTAPRSVPAFIIPVAPAGRTDSVVYSHANLPSGRHIVQVQGVTLPDLGDARRPYGLTITTTPDFQIQPDGSEPNDSPQDPGSPVSVPFDRSDMAAENPWSIDNYVFDVGVPSEIMASVAGQGGNLDLFLIAGDTLDWNFGYGTSAVLATGFSLTSSEAIQATVPAGRYNIVVQEFGGEATTYRLQITATPSSATGPFTISAPLPPAAPAHWPSLLARGVVKPAPIPRVRVPVR